MKTNSNTYAVEIVQYTSIWKSGLLYTWAGFVAGVSCAVTFYGILMYTR